MYGVSGLTGAVHDPAEHPLETTLLIEIARIWVRWPRVSVVVAEGLLPTNLLVV
jgi:hypothetical protein